MVSPNPFLINTWSVDVNWHFDFVGHIYLYSLFHFHLPIYVDWLVDVYWFIYDDGIMVDRLINVYSLLDYFRNFYLFYNDLWDFLLDFDVFGNLNDLLDYSFGSGDVLGNFNFHFHWFFHNYLLDSLLWHLLGHILGTLLQDLILHLQFELFSF